MAPALIREIDDETSPAIKGLALTPVESNLRRLLLDVAEHVDNNPSSTRFDASASLPDELATQPIVLRFTGGWVRDKLLGVPSHDIDVAINKMTGYQFGLRLKEYLEIPGNAEKYGLEGIATSDKQSQQAGASDKSKVVGGLHKIEANPEKSKHLETVTTKILGLDIDLVNLRKETYTDDSRNPQMEFGTPKEDALRRDATVNAMFYNLNTEEVEDLTGRGRDDLRDRVLRTPMEAFQTFKDDPLRVLRLIRFASRLGYVIEPSAQAAMQETKIKSALQQKISRERVGVELEKALRGPDPHEALRLIFSLELYETVFTDPTIEHTRHYRPETQNWETTIDSLRDIRGSGNALSDVLIRDEEDVFLAWQLAAIVPYRNAPVLEPPEPGRRAPPPIAASVVREGVKATNKVCDVVTMAVRHHGEIANMVRQLYRQSRGLERTGAEVVQDAGARDVLGMAIRRWGASWRSQVMYALCASIADEPTAKNGIEREYTMFIERLRDLDILEAYTFKPLMDGKELAKALKTRPGPWMKDALDVVMAYQLRNPQTANVNEAIAEVQSHEQHDNAPNGMSGELTSSLNAHFLKLTIRPLFAKAKPLNVTDAGRRNTRTVLPPKLTVASQDDSVSRPWKNVKDAYVLDLLKWCVRSLDASTVEQQWPWLVPPCLTLLDDWEAKYKTLGAELLRNILQITPAGLLQRTGLGQVFEDALLPCLTFLPSVTPEAESAALLNAVYPTLLVLADVRFADTISSANSKQTNGANSIRQSRTKFLDTIIRKGVIYAYTYCSSYPRITQALFTHLASLLDAEGIESVKHLKYILPMLTETLGHPPGAAHRPALIAAVKALQAIILNGWPRMPEHRGEVLKGLTLCWVHVRGVTEERGGADGVELESAMKETLLLLRAALARAEDVDFEADVRTLLAAEPRLSDFFE